jgi:hypothetical protein
MKRAKGIAPPASAIASLMIRTKRGSLADAAVAVVASGVTGSFGTLMPHIVARAAGK